MVAADVYAVAPHVGRGGWSWYTGSSGWMYRLVVESLLIGVLQTFAVAMDQSLATAGDDRDQLLVSVAERLKECVRPDDTVAYLLPNCLETAVVLVAILLPALRAGEVVFVDGANDFAPVNKGQSNFSMLITLVRR